MPLVDCAVRGAMRNGTNTERLICIARRFAFSVLQSVKQSFLWKNLRSFHLTPPSGTGSALENAAQEHEKTKYLKTCGTPTSEETKLLVPALKEFTDQSA